jgi:hypothetical protein
MIRRIPDVSESRTILSPSALHFLSASEPSRKKSISFPEEQEEQAAKAEERKTRRYYTTETHC